MTYNKKFNLLVKGMHDQHASIQNAMEKFTDWLIDTFDVNRYADGTFLEHIKEENTCRQEYTDLLFDWCEDVTKALENGKTTDYFGGIYEEYFKGKSKAGSLGQFFTPESVSSMMGELVGDDCNEYCVVNDCCCGSGRLPLGHYERSGKNKDFAYYVCSDLDYSSCKMCALNFMIHGIIGIVYQQDALLLSRPGIIYIINEADYPIRCNCYSITKLTLEDAMKRGIFIQNGEQYIYNEKYTEYIKSLKDRARGILNIVGSIEMLSIHKVETHKEPQQINNENKQTLKEPIQLTLFD